MSNNETLQAQLKIWLAAVGHQDAAAFRSLYDATSSKLYGFALRILYKRELAEDVLQESFVSIWNNAAGYQTSLSAPMTWMTTIVRNKAFDLLRRASQSANVRVSVLAARMVEQIASHEPQTTGESSTAQVRP